MYILHLALKTDGDTAHNFCVTPELFKKITKQKPNYKVCSRTDMQTHASYPF